MTQLKQTSTLFLLGLLLCASAASAQEDSTWTLDRCVTAAMQQSARLAAAAQSVSAARAAAGESAANRWPVLGASGAYSYNSEVMEMEFTLPIPGVTIPPMKFGDAHVYDMAATARVPIFSGGALRENSRAGKAALNAARNDYVSDSVRLSNDVRRAFYNALGAHERADAARHSVRRLERHLDDIEAAQKIGTASEEMRIQALSKLRQSEQIVLSLESAARSARLSLGYLVGRPESEIAPGSELSESLIASGGVPEIEYDARPEVGAVRSRIQQTRHLASATRGSLWPALSGSAAYHYSKPGVNVQKNEWMDYYTLGVSATWTLWDWKSRGYRVQQTEANRRGLEARESDLVASLKTRLASARQGLEAAQEAAVKAAERAALEQQRLQLVEGRQKAGMASETEFLDAQDDFFAAETDLATSTVQLRLAEVELLSASGH